MRDPGFRTSGGFSGDTGFPSTLTFARIHSGSFQCPIHDLSFIIPYPLSPILYRTGFGGLWRPAPGTEGDGHISWHFQLS